MQDKLRSTLKKLRNLDNSMIAKSSRIDHQELYLKLSREYSNELASNNNLAILSKIIKG